MLGPPAPGEIPARRPTGAAGAQGLMSAAVLQLWGKGLILLLLKERLFQAAPQRCVALSIIPDGFAPGTPRVNYCNYGSYTLCLEPRVLNKCLFEAASFVCLRPDDTDLLAEILAGKRDEPDKFLTATHIYVVKG